MSRHALVNVLVMLLLVLAAATVVGLVTYWPDRDRIRAPAGTVAPDTESAEVIAVSAAPCGEVSGRRDCLRIRAELTSGEDRGREVEFHFTRTEGRFEVGDRIRVYESPIPPGAVGPSGQAVDTYAFADFERRPPMLWLVAIFVALVLLTSRLQGLRALAGLAASLAIVVFFIAPAILEGSSPTGVAFVGALAIMLITIPLTHGLGAKTVAACLGTATSLTLTLVLADLFVGLAHLSGLTSEEAIYLGATNQQLSLQGLVLAGMVIGALGVLDDLTVSQASTVMALRRANAGLRFRELFGTALQVGHDHIAATVNTLVLAYAGAALPIVLVFSLAETSVGEALNFEAVAEAIVGMLVGSIGLIVAVPVTTALAALLALRLGQDELAVAHAGHGH